MISRIFCVTGLIVAICPCVGTVSLAQTGTANQQLVRPPEAQTMRARIDCNMAKAMSLANRGHMPEATEIADRVWCETHDPAVGFAVVQLLEKTATTLPTPCSMQPKQRAANIARELIVQDSLPRSFQRQLPVAIYHEAVALAEAGQLDLAIKVLRESFDVGFTGFDIAAKETAFLESGVDSKLHSVVEESREKAILRLKDESKAELDSFNSFPFDLETVDIEARNFSLKSLQGKIVVIDFWGTWCPLCRQQLPSLARLQKEFPNTVEVVGVAFENGMPESASEHVQESMLDSNVNYRCVLGDPAIQKSVPGFSGFPSSLFLDRSGKVRMLVAGENSYEKYLSIVQLLMEETGQ